MALGGLALASCGTRRSAQVPLQLAGTEWQLLAYQEGNERQEAITERPGTLSFTVDKIAGSTGCNQYGGLYKLEESKLTTEAVFSTKMACRGRADVQERVFFAVLSAQPTVQQTDDGLVLSADKGTLYFKASPVKAPQSARALPAEAPAQERVAMAAAGSRFPEAVASTTGMFAYMADAAVFISCADNKRYPVAMEGGYLELERAYLSLMGDEAGKQAMLCAKATLMARDKMEGSGQTPTLVVSEMYSLSRQATCKTAIIRMAGEYYLEANAAMFSHCDDGQRYAIATDAAAAKTREAYQALNLLPGARVYAEVEGYLDSENPNRLHLSRLVGFKAGETCH